MNCQFRTAGVPHGTASVGGIAFARGTRLLCAEHLELVGRRLLGSFSATQLERLGLDSSDVTWALVEAWRALNEHVQAEPTPCRAIRNQLFTRLATGAIDAEEDRQAIAQYIAANACSVGLPLFRGVARRMT